jgi:hypothetical protein
MIQATERDRAHSRSVNAVRMQLQEQRLEGIWTRELDVLPAQASAERAARDQGSTPPAAQHLSDGV